MGARPNPHYLYTRPTAIRIRIYAQSAEPGAMPEEHEALCETLVDATVIAIREWTVSNRQAEPIWTEARYLRASEIAADFEEPEQWAGVVYQLKLQVRRAVVKLNFDGTALPEATIAKVKNRVLVSYGGASEAPPVVAFDNTEES